MPTKLAKLKEDIDNALTNLGDVDGQSPVITKVRSVLDGKKKVLIGNMKAKRLQVILGKGAMMYVTGDNKGILTFSFYPGDGVALYKDPEKDEWNPTYTVEYLSRRMRANRGAGNTNDTVVREGYVK